MTESGPTESTSPTVESGSNVGDAKVIERLKVCRDMALEFSDAQFPLFLQQLDDRLFELASKSVNNQEQALLGEIQKEFKQHREELLRYFRGSVGEAYIKFKKGTLDTRSEDNENQNSHLSLIENEELEESIAMSSIALRADSHFAEQVWTSSQRYAVLRGGEKVQESSNPSSPIQFCDALRRALGLMDIGVKSKIYAYKVFDRAFIPKLGGFLESINEYLTAEGLLPNLKFTPGVDRSPMPPAATFANAEQALASTQRSEAPAGTASSQDGGLYQGNLLGAIRELQTRLAGELAVSSGGISVPSNAVPLGGVPNNSEGRMVSVYSNQQLVGALQNLQSQALSMTTEGGEDGLSVSTLSPQGVAATSSLLTQQLQRDNEEAAAVDHADMHTIDLVGMLFEYMLADENLPHSVKALLSYLHTPFLKIAFIDFELFEQGDHPARLLLNNLAEAGTRWVRNDGSSEYEMYSKIKSIVSRLLEDFENDVQIFTDLLLEFNTYTKKIARRQDLMERRVLEKVQGEERLREVKVQVNRAVRARTDEKQLPSVVLLLLLQPWSDYLSFILLRYGEESGSWKDGLKTIDDVLWSITPKESNDEKSEQAELLESLPEKLDHGFETIAYDRIKAQKLLDGLFSLQKLAIQCKELTPAPLEMRDKLEALAAEKAGDLRMDEQAISAAEEKMMENLKLIEFGTWFEFSDQARLKVAWYNAKTSHYMLVDQKGKKVAMKSGLELAREMIAGNAKVIAGSTKPFFERALENILDSLNEKMSGVSSTRGDVS